ncbi:hypothetical protein PsYK624_036070 [Phanerochaete sordida]|uniref:Transmembrane protein n=1 Tax=Phanerochaete sordida TaxID=48140 RepID=A0A9P3G458_9APHY|nr:hypothetical protein PsYK624_036070 [Phanerochaete sordida]
MNQTPYNGTAYIVDDTDPSISYSSGWLRVTTDAEYNDTKTGANAAGMTATFVFNGTEIEVYGSLGSWDVYGVPVSTYEIDGLPGTQTTYTAPLITPGTFSSHVLFYRSPPLSAAEHTLVITDTNGTAPSVYWLDYIIYAPSSGVALAATSSSQGSTSQTSSSTSSSSLAASSSTTSSSSSSSGSPTSLPAKASTSHAGAIAGGVVGGVAFLAALVLLLFWFCYRKRPRGTPEDEVLYEAWPTDRVARPSNVASTEKRARTASVPLTSGETSSASFGVGSASGEPGPRTPQASQMSMLPAGAMQPESPLVRVHSDSGFRLPPGKVVDIPPAYTDD